VVIIRKAVLFMVLTLLKVANRLLNWIEPKPTHPLVDDLILTGDPGGRYVLPPPPVGLRVIRGGKR
jgi:hypothetical protein